MSAYNFDGHPSEEPMRVPRRFKTAFIFFSSARHKEMKEELALEGKAEKVSYPLSLRISENRTI